MDAVTLKRAQKGDPAAFEALFTPLEGRAYRTCVHVLGPGEDARDCAQEVLLKAFRTLKDFRGDCALESWLHRLCVNVCLDALRKKKLRAAQSLDALVKKMEETAIDPQDQVVFLSHGDCLEDAKYVAKQVKEKLGVKEVKINFIGPVIGAHSGPGTVALFFLGNPR